MSGNLAPVLIQYNLYPDYIETVGSVRKLISPEGIYALKETKLTAEQRSWFLHVIERLQHLEYPRFVAPFPTKHGNLLTVFEGKTYYLTPWLEEKSQGILSPEEKLMEAAAALHVLTDKEQSYSDEVMQVSFRTLTQRWTTYEQTLENFAASIESKIHYSPFELSFLSGYREVMGAISTAKDCLANWLERSKKNKQFRVVLCHGRLSTNHFINDKMINLEHAVLDSPVCDLAFLIRSSASRGVIQTEDPHDWLQTYEERFPLRMEERILLAAYLIFPEPIYRSVREYGDPRSGKNEWINIEKLEQRLSYCHELQKLAMRILNKK